METLEAAGRGTVLREYPDGTRILVMPHGGRLLGLFGSRTDENFLWTNPALDAVGSAQALFESVTWHNSGGDRTWVSPELDFFFPKYPDLSVYRQPPELDPGNYTLVESRG